MVRIEDGRTLCDKCGKPATVNFQKLWVKWKVLEAGGYSERYELLGDQDPSEGDNLHYCDECARKWEQGEV